ncbi:hypothetical protein RMSM_07828 [Rhodopirellula maiorica SM1]|uniref:Uncharacterized protein n=1 Tax=Rhodopirellula maiorica SM1 TaxID=1265738 RepID=M5R773_9BACT|nr:hypothetical protein RMSM_07828 [Rhodopirellula maiorica SM1]
MKVELIQMQSTYAINEIRPKRVLAKNTNAEDEFWDRDVNTRHPLQKCFQNKLLFAAAGRFWGGVTKPRQRK